MKVRLLYFWENVRSSYWFVPGLMVVVAIGLSFLMIAIDQQVQFQWIQAVGWFWAGGPEGARGLLSTVAGSMITVAGVVFSITLVVLSLASSQFGPRLLYNFMRDTGNQVVLGTFIATFIYCLLILRTVRGQDENTFIPYISVSFSIVLVLASLGVLIYFIHHVALSIQAPYVIAAVAHDLLDTIDRLFPEKFGFELANHKTVEGDKPKEDGKPIYPHRESFVIEAKRSGYLQAIDEEGLMEIAIENDLVLWVKHRPGHFVVQGLPLVKAWPPQRIGDDLAAQVWNTFILGRQRTHTQDVEFAIEQLVEVAVRALSPGINDPYTAMTCIDWLSVALFRLTEKNFPAAKRYDHLGHLRIIIDRPATFAGAVDAAFNQIRQFAQENVAVRIRLLEAIAAVSAKTDDDEKLEALSRQAEMIMRGSEEEEIETEDRKDIAERYLEVLRAQY